MALFEFPHVLHQPLQALDRHRVVDRGAHAADRAVALELHHAALRGAFQERLVELRVRQREGHVHARTVLFRHRVAVEARAVEIVVEQLALRDVAPFDLGEAAQRLEPFEYQRGDVDRVAGRRIEHGVRLGLQLVVHHTRCALGRLSDEVVAHDDDRHARRADVLLRAGVDQPELGELDRPRQEGRRGVGNERDLNFWRRMELHPADGLVRAVVDVRRVRALVPLLGRIGELAIFRCGGDMHIAIALRFLDCLLRPFTGRHVVGLALAAQQVHRHLRELQRGAAGEEQHLVVRRHGEELAQVLLRLRGDADELASAMAHLHHRHAAAVPVEHLVAGTGKHFRGQHRRARAEIENARHQCTVGGGASGGTSSAGGASDPGSPWPPLPPLPLPRSRSSMRSMPASFSPSESAISVTPCVERPISRICATLVRINTPPVEMSITSSLSSTSTAPTTLPLRSEVWIEITPWPPRPWRGYSPSGVRLPKPFWVAVRTPLDSLFAASMQTTRWPSPRRMPRTPVAWRPIGRTSPSSKRTALPSEEKSITSYLPSVSAAPTR